MSTQIETDVDRPLRLLRDNDVVQVAMEPPSIIPIYTRAAFRPDHTEPTLLQRVIDWLVRLVV